MSAQYLLPLEVTKNFSKSAFVVSKSNKEAWTLIENQPTWPSGGLIIVGPAQSGKTHLGTIWAEKNGAFVWSPQDHVTFLKAAAFQSVLVDVPFQTLQKDGGKQLLEVYNIVREQGRSLLILSRTSPATWSGFLPDLLSRLKTLPLTRLAPPDDTLFKKILYKYFADHQMPFDPSWGEFILNRIERSFEGVGVFCALLGQQSLVAQKKVSLALIRQCVLALSASADRSSGA
jgi:chromosomal replication initiation ATPase DnaA